MAQCERLPARTATAAVAVHCAERDVPARALPGAACLPGAKRKVRATGSSQAGGRRESRRVLGGSGSGGASADHGLGTGDLGKR
ncbi:hypothetical protein PAHAL_2G341900 [Panicum hallii]|uniref:Uncharacterized protein n=1 Tax=Panicum hallii TaxID=206008 RepID=A0A2S3H1J5_9POAL|nr:hypothetical protein PAHAL_2G341900 [Panicum hallii]